MSTMEACDEDDEDHKASLRKILEDFRRSLREEFRDSVTEADDQAGSVGMPATDVNTTSSGNVCLQTEHQPRAQSASKRAPGNKPPRTKSVLHDPRIMRQIRPLNHDLSLNNGYKQKLTNVDDQPLNSNQTQNMEQLEDQSSNNDHKQKIALDDDHFLQYDHKQKMAKPDDQLLTNDHKQMAQLDNQSLHSDHKQKVALVDVQSLHNDHKHEVVLGDDQSLTNDPNQKLTSLDDQSLKNNHKQKLRSLDDQSLNNNHKQKLTSLDGQSSTDTSDAQTIGDISIARNSDRDIAENIRTNSVETLSSVDKIERRHVSDTDYTYDTRLAQRTNPATGVVGDVTSEPRQTQQFNSLCPNNTGAGLYEDHERLTPSSILSYDENKDVQSEPESRERSAMCKTRTDDTRVDARQQYDHKHVTPDNLTMDGSIMSQTEGGDTISNCSHTSSSIFECGESSDRQFFDTMGTPESVSTLFDDIPVYTGNTGSLIIPGGRSATPYFTGHLYGDSEDDTNDYGDEQTLEPGQSRVDQDGAKDDMGQSSDSGDLTEQLTASFSEHTGHLMPVTDDRSIQKDGLHSKPGDEYSSEASETPGHLNVEYSLMPCVLADCDGVNPGTADAQAQARAEQRKNSEVHLKFGSDGLHINTDNANDSSGHFQQQITPLQQKYSPLPQHLTPLYDPHYDRERAVGDANYHLNPYPTTYITSLPEFTDSASTNSYGFPAVFEAGSNNGRGIEISQTDNRIIPFSSEENNSNSNPYTLGEYEHNDRRRRLGRDHTNYVLPSSGLTLFKDNVNSDNSLGALGTDYGPPGLPFIGDSDVYSEEAGLKLVVLDKTDDEDDFFHPSPHESGDHTRLYGSSYTPRSHNDVFPIDRRAIDRDLYKQVFDPTAEAVKTSRSASVHTLGANPSAANTNPGATNTFVVRGNTTQQEYNYQNNPTSAPGMLIHVTDYDTETEPDTGRTSLRSSAAQLHQSPIGHSPNNIVAHGHLHEYYGQPYNQIARNSQINSATRQLYSMSQIDYDRYTSNASQLSVDHHDSYTDRAATFHKAHGSGLSGIHPITQGPTHPANEPGNHPEARVLAPGYKFQVNKYNVAKRASIVNRAEQLLDSRRGQFTDRSESSDELERIEEDDDEDFDGIDDMNGPRHRALKHLQRRVYDDSTSYNSSDDVLHNMRYPARGPVSQAARRARLTSVNARLKKQKRSRTTRRQQVRPPSPVVSDTEDSSSENDITEPRSSHKQLHDLNRYEEPNVVDPEKGDNLLHPNNSETTPGPVGRRVMFFRNGDIHYKPKQVLINNKTYTNLEKLLVDLSSMVETSTGVKYIFSWPEGREVKSITELENGKYYICSSTNKLQRVDYGNSKESQWKVGKIDRQDYILFKQTAKIQSPLRRPRVLTVISNMKRDSREKLILNTNSQMNFEDVLNDISNMINIPNPPVKALYTEKKPHLKVESYSQLMRDFADEDSFIACGEEMVPLEMSSIRSSQTAGGRGSKKPPTRNLMSEPQRIQEDPTTARSSEGTNTRDNAKVRRRKTDSVRVDINGRTRDFFPPKQLEPNDDGQKPAKKLRLTWVYGYRGRDVKQNLAVLSSTEELVYFVAAVVVVYNKKLSSQKHYLGHSEEITCLAVHPNGRFIATGQTAGKTQATGAHVRIWDGVSLSTFSIIGLGTFQQGVACLNFSEKDVLVKGRMESLAAGDLLMTVDESDRHVLSVWEWQTEKLIARTSTTSEPVVSGSFYASDVNTLITYGKEHIHFWRMFWEKGGKIMRDKLSGNFQDTVPKYVTSICSAPSGDVISGDSSGAILVWTRDNNHIFTLNRNISAQTRRAHQKSVSALCMLGDGTLLSGGGNVLKAWDSINNYCLVKERVLPESAGHVRSIVPMKTGGLDGSIYVATTRNKVLEGSLQLKFTVIVQGHVEELWAVECHPSEETFVSAGHDQAVVKWSAISHVPVWRVNVENPCTSISIDPRGRLIAVGTTAGKVVILNSSSGVQVTSLMSGTAQINALSFSPDGKQLAIGTFQGLIHIFHVQDDGRSFFRPHASSLKGNGMFIMHLDWSMDSKMIQAAMGDYEVVIWNVITMQRIRSGSNLRDVKWASHNTPISYSTIGPWQNLDSGDVINVVCRSQGGDVQVAGDTSGRLRLYKWPCSVAKAGYRQTKVYSSNVTCTSFTCDDKYLITSGGNDAALMQFSVLDTANAR